MRTPLFELQHVLDAFQGRKVLTKPEILNITGCSSMTAWRLLRRHGYFSSYNDNARHYTLVDIPRFDEHGLWSHGPARFSQWGALTTTLVRLVEASAAGLTAEQLEQLLQLNNVKPHLTRLIAKDLLVREKMEGRFVYFARPQTPGMKQKQRRQKDLRQTHAAQLPPLEQIIALLVEIIRRPQNTPRQWARQLSRHGVRIKMDEIQAVLEHYQIDPKNGLLTS